MPETLKFALALVPKLCYNEKAVYGTIAAANIANPFVRIEDENESL